MANICSLEEIIESFNDSPSTLFTGFQCIDQLAGGLHSGSVITIGARTGMGKTSFASNPQVISNSNLRGSKVLGHVNHDS